MRDSEQHVCACEREHGTRARVLREYCVRAVPYAMCVYSLICREYMSGCCIVQGVDAVSCRGCKGRTVCDVSVQPNMSRVHG